MSQKAWATSEGMRWIEFNEPGAPLSFSYPESWTLLNEESLQLVSPAGSAFTWSIFGSEVDLGEGVTCSEQELEQSAEMAGRSWSIARRNVMLMVTYFADPTAIDDEREIVDRIIASARPDPDLPADADALVLDVEIGLKRTFPDKNVRREGFGLAVEDLGVLNLANIYRAIQFSPDSRDDQVEQCVRTFSAVQRSEAVLADYAQARELLFPLIVSRGEDSDHSRVLRDLNRALQIAYAVDFGPAMARVTVELLETWGVDAVAVHEQALCNLSARCPLELKPVNRDGVDCVLTEFFTFATAQVLLPEYHAALHSKLGATFLVAMPSRDIAIASAEENRDALSRFAAQDFEEYPHALSPVLFRCSAEKLECLSEKRGLLGRLFGN